ncbi:MAG TPA: hypothetical protein VFR01_08080, partial [Geobacterales bacterium]|nr:hypothetical protein [Geobacterales bacterium]
REVVRLASERRQLTSMAEESGYRLDTLISRMGNKEEKASPRAQKKSEKAKTASSAKKVAPGGKRGSKRRQ